MTQLSVHPNATTHNVPALKRWLRCLQRATIEEDEDGTLNSPIKFRDDVLVSVFSGKHGQEVQQNLRFQHPDM